MKWVYNTFITVTAQTTDVVEQTATQADIVGIGGILATIFCCIVTCVVTCILTMKSIRQLKLAYSMQVIPILPNRISGIDELTISYKNVVLKQPCILNLDIKNIGNAAIENGDITIKTTEDIEIIPGYIDNISPGYEEKWKLQRVNESSSKIHLEYINPKQDINVKFFLTDIPKSKFTFACPMPNLQIQETKSKQEASLVFGRFNALEKAAVLLSGILILCVAMFDSWYYLLHELIWAMNLREFLVPEQLAAFLLLFLGCSIVVCFMHISIIDQLILKYPRSSIITECILVLVSIIGLVLIVFNFVYGISQYLIAIIALILLVLCLYIHLSRAVYK